MNANPNHNILSLIIINFSTFLVSVSMGMNSILFPTTMEAKGYNTLTIGAAMSLEIAALVFISIVLPKTMRYINMPLGLIISTLIRVPPLLGLVLFVTLPSWMFLFFVHGLGAAAFLLFLQTWVNSIPFQKNKGLLIASFGTVTSLGLAAGPVVLQFTNEIAPLASQLINSVGMFQLTPEMISQQGGLIVSAMISLTALIPLFAGMPLIPLFEQQESTKIMSIIKRAPAIMFALALSGATIFGVQYFITIYGLKNELSVTNASFLLTAFMMGSLILEAPLSWVSDFFDRRYIIMVAVFLSMVCTVYLPIAIYVPLQAWILLFIWGGVIGTAYSVCLILIGERFSEQELVAANSAISIMESIGGTIGIFMIGLSMHIFDVDGLPYVIMFISVLYFSYALTRYQVV